MEKTYVMDASIIVAIVIAVPGIVSLILQMRKDKVVEKSTEAEIIEKIRKTSSALIDDMQRRMDELVKDNNANAKSTEKRITALQTCIDDMEVRITKLTIGINQLVTQIRGLGAEPCWKPDDLSGV